MTKKNFPSNITPPFSEFELKLIQTFREMDVECREYLARMAFSLALDFPLHKKPCLTIVKSTVQGANHV